MHEDVQAPSLLLALMGRASASEEAVGERSEEGLQRWNTHFSTEVCITLFGSELRLSQNPQSLHLGTTVWDASIVLAKWLEHNAR